MAGFASAHGGAFRPPPPLPSRDPVQPGGGLTVNTPHNNGLGKVDPWERWWEYHRDEFLKMRAHIARARPVTGKTHAKDFFDRDRLRREKVLPLLRAALADPSPEVRVAAAIGVGKLGDRDSVASLRALWDHDPKGHVQEAALVGLVLMRDPTLTEWMRDVVRNDQRTRRERGLATIGLGLLHDVAFLSRMVLFDQTLKLRGSTPDMEEWRAAAAVALGFTASPLAAGPLLEVAKTKIHPRGARGLAAAALGRLGSPLATPELLDLLAHEQLLSEVRYGASIALGRLVTRGETATIDRMGAIAQKDRNGGVRALLFLSLGRIGGDRAALHIRDELQTREQTVRGFMLLAMGMTQSDLAGEFLMKEWPSIKHPADRGACALGLALAGHAAATAQIRAELARKNGAFLPHGLIALGLLRDRSSLPLIEDIVRGQTNTRVVSEAVLALALIDGPSAIDKLVVVFEKTKSARVRAAVAGALGTVGTPRAFEAMAKIYFTSKKPHTRALAVAVVGRIADPSELPLIAQFALDFNAYAPCEALRLLVTIR